jgi:antitoxin component YwqK of YwqJK toxin-antitoxin module
MERLYFYVFLAGSCLFLNACLEKPTEKVLSRYPHDLKQVSVWIYPDGSVEKKAAWYFNGIQESETPYKNGKPHGDYIRWTSHGDVAETGRYENGLQEGEWIEWFGNRTKQSMGHYRAGKKEGRWQGFYYGGEPAWERYYRNDSMVGTWKSWHPNGKLAEFNTCLPGTENGLLIKYSSKGIKQSEESCAWGKRNGIVKYYYPSGALETLSHYDKDTLHGESILYRANHRVWKKSFWKKGLRDSLWLWYDSEGHITHKSLFILGTGIAYGERAESTFVDNQLHGTLRYSREGRSLHYEEIWNHGQLEMSRSLYPDSLGGKLASEGFYKNGKRDGIWRNWYATGTLKDSLQYRDGEPYGSQFSYDSTGKLYFHKEQAGRNRPLLIYMKKN